MSTKRVIPKFGSEVEAAKWFDGNVELIEQMFEEAAAKGKLKRLRLADRPAELKPGPSKNVMIRLPIAEIDRARQLAARKGLRYQTYIKMLLYEAMNRDEAQA